MAIESGHATSAGPMRAAVVHPRPRRHPGGGASEYRTPEAYLAEAVGLAKAIALDVRHAEVVGLNEVHPKTYIGSGKVESLAATIAAHEIGVVIFDGPLTGAQQRNLEKDLAAKVIDRTGLILEIFGQRARTAEGALQVELAALEYQKSRLVRSWTHLERQRGGFGFLGGPGETQIEADRRVIRDRIGKIKRELDRTKKRAGCIARTETRCRGRRLRWSATQTPESRRYSIASPARRSSRPTCCLRRSTRRCAGLRCRPAAR